MMDLAARWERLCTQLGIPDAVGVYETHIAPRYAEPHRVYHDTTHLDACLSLFSILGEGEMRDRESSWLGPVAATDIEIATAELALWFHDVVYDPQRFDNEERSVELLRDLLSWYAPDRQVIEDASALIMLTKTHDTRDLKGRGRLVVLDVDLSILGEDPFTYWRYEHAIRQEYSFVPEDVYARERVKVLQKFLDREREGRLFRTPLFHAKFNNQARQNLAHAIAYLRTMPVRSPQPPDAPSSTAPASALP